MHSAVAFIIAVGVFATFSHAAPLDLGAGGVFKGAEAQNYFATRFGGDFFTRLAAVMAKSGAAAASTTPSRGDSKSVTRAQKRPKKEDTTKELKFVTKQLSDSEPVVVEVSDSLYREAVTAPRTTKDAAYEVDITFEEQQTNAV